MLYVTWYIEVKKVNVVIFTFENVHVCVRVCQCVSVRACNVFECVCVSLCVYVSMLLSVSV